MIQFKLEMLQVRRLLHISGKPLPCSVIRVRRTTRAAHPDFKPMKDQLACAPISLSQRSSNSLRLAGSP